MRRTGTAGGVGLITVTTYLLVLGLSVVLGERSWREERFADAERWFRVADRIDVVERWKAPYNLGVAVFSQGRWLEAAELFGRARALAPDDARCRVVLNEALALEALGDELDEAGDQMDARARWAQAQQVLAGAEGCSASGSDGDAAEGAQADGDASSKADPGEDGDPAEDGDDPEGDGDPAEDGDSEGDDSEGDDGQGEAGEQGEDGDAREDGQDGSGESGDATAGGEMSEAEQLYGASQRLMEKMSGARARETTADAELPQTDKAAELQERMSGAARRRASQQDASVPGTGGGSDRPTW